MKAIFLDFMGTAVEQKGPALKELVQRLTENSDVSTPKEVMKIWWKGVKELEANSYKESFISEDDIIDVLLERMQKEHGLHDNFSELHELMNRFWCTAPLFDDAKRLFERSPYPIYMVSNNPSKYMRQAVEGGGVRAAGYICGEQVHSYKPHPELFEEALRQSGFQADEVVHIGDSYASDVVGARSAGIQPILVLRGHAEPHDDVMCVRSIDEIAF